MNLLNLTGAQYGKLTVVCRTNNQGKHVAWLCRCECGREKIVQSNHLREGSIRSCGQCSYKTDHWSRVGGASHSRLYRSVWNKILQRCYNAANKDYPNYGGRGIKMCDEWKDFLAFQEWALSNGYDPNAKYGECTLDRIDVNGDYCPENCRFTTTKQQNRNKTNTYWIDVDGERIACSEYAERMNIDPDCLYSRLRRGWSLEDAVNTPVGVKRRVM